MKARILTPLLLVIALASGAVTAADREPFDDRYCTTCHGTDGKGNEGVQAPRLAGMEDWYLKRQLENFRAEIRGVHQEDIEGIAMQPMAALLTDESIEDIVEWVGAWEYVPTEPTIEGNVATGRQLFSACASCHGQNGEGIEALGAPQLAGQNDWYMVTQLKNFMAGYRGDHAQDTYGLQMRTMVQTLRDEDGIRNVVSYINTLSAD